MLIGTKEEVSEFNKRFNINLILRKTGNMHL